MKFMYLYVLWLFFIPIWLSRKKYVEREKPKWIIFLLSLPISCLILFMCLFAGDKTYCSFTIENIFYWLGCSVLMWLVTVPVIFFGTVWRDQRWEKPRGEIEDDVDDLFDSAMNICKEKREGKNTSTKEAEYKRQMKDFEENG